MQSRRAVEQYRMAFGDFFKNIPDFRSLALDHLFRAAYRVHVPEIFQPSNNKRLEKHERHLLRQPALMQLQFRADDNHGPTRVIDAFAEQVLAEPAPLTFEHVAQRFQGAIAGASHGATVSTVIKQSVHRLLEHSLFVANDDIWCFEEEKVFEPVITINDPAIEIVQVRRRKTPAFKWNQRTQIRWNDRQHVENHPLRPRVRILE